MKRIAALIVLSALSTAGLAALANAATTSQRPPLREFEGRVVSVDRSARTFRLHDSERGTKRIKVTRSTRFERVAGLAGLRAGQRAIEVKTRRKVGRAWIAIEVEKSGGGGEHGGDRDGDSGGDGDGGRGRDDADDD
ncbi:MAG TPA: hypothetical protein VNO82_09830 [Solirubrobacteraceae bacterium]|nr:hypothetical protein [Solirubrobacteraceae bacterium]